MRCPHAQEVTSNGHFMQQPSTERPLSHRTSRAGAWASASRIVKALQLVSGVVLARVLTPQDFGLVAVALAAITLTDALTATGLGSALIQRAAGAEEYLDAVWTFELLRGFALAGILSLLAPIIASFFAEPRAIPILRVISLTYVLTGLRNVGIVLLRKELRFAKLFMLDVGSVLAYVAAAIPLALALRNAWALVGALLAQQVVACLLSYCVHPHRPRVVFDLGRTRELFGFGKWILGQGLVEMAQRTGINIFVGRALGVLQLGLYNRAEVFSRSVFDELGNVVWQVLYPTYSSLQRASSRLAQVYIKTLELLCFIGMPMAGGLFVLSGDFTRLFLTDKWLPIVPVMQVLCVLAVLSFVTTPCAILFQAVGRPSIGTKVSVIGLLLFAGLIYPAASRWGLPGVAGALLAGLALTAPITVCLANRLAGCKTKGFLQAVGFPFACTIVMVLAMWGIRVFVMREVRVPGFVLLITYGGSTYVVSALVLAWCSKWSIFRTLKGILVSLRG